MKRILLATSALAATVGIASAQGGGGVTLTGTASLGVLGGGWIVDTVDEHRGAGRQNDSCTGVNNCPIPGQTEYELHTDIDVTFTMYGQTDTGLAFGASIDLDESDGSSAPVRGNSNAFDGRAQGGEEIFISGAFGTLTMGDTDGALDWALQEIAIGGSLNDAHTVHDGYNGNGFADSLGGGQIARYDYSFGDFGVAVSANISDADPDATDDEPGDQDILAVGAKYNASLAAMELGIGIGYSQLGYEDNEENNALGVSLDANFNNGFRAILNWVDMGDSDDDIVAEQYVGVGLGYVVNDWTFAANWGEYTEDVPNTENDRGQSGYAVVVNYDLGGGAEIQFGYSRSTCEKFPAFNTMVTNPVESDAECRTDNFKNSAASLGVAMSF